MLKESDITLETASATDIDFAETLVRSNMTPYFSYYGIKWLSEKFRNNWPSFENKVIKKRLVKVGILSFCADVDRETILYICDIQLLPEYQHQGIGTWVLNKIDALANERNFTSIRLRVFKKNAAKNLYFRHGYKVSVDEKNTLGMEKILGKT